MSSPQSDGKARPNQGGRPSAINAIWLFLILIAIVVAAWTGKMGETTQASFDGAKDAVTLAISLVGAMTLWLGIMKVAEVGGLMRLVARALRPIMVRLFPDVPPEHPAMAAMILNMSANALGLGIAATPMGIKAMQELDTLNPEKGTATDAMCLFLAINTSNVALLPLGTIAVRAGAGAANPAAILVPTILATACSTAVAIVVAKTLARRSPMPRVTAGSASATGGEAPEAPVAAKPETLSPPGRIARMAGVAVLLALLLAIPYRLFLRIGAGSSLLDRDALTAATQWLIPIIMVVLLLFGFLRGVKIYETLTDGAKEGFEVAVRIMPFMVAIFAAIAMVRASGALDAFVGLLGPLTSPLGMPAEALPMALLRPLSGTGAFGFMAEAVRHDPNGFVAFLTSVMQGSTETTFYVLAVYFGSVAIRKTRHALTAGLLADAAGIVAAVLFSRLFFS